MNRFRRRRLQSRLAILAGLMLLWSQFVLVLHPAYALMNPGTSAVIQLSTTEHAACHEHAPTQQSAVCKVHCSQGDQSDAVGHVPSLPYVPAATIVATPTAVVAASLHSLTGIWTPVSWHRPTRHPASLLLI